MVSGFVTSPLDHERIWSVEASEMRMALNSLTSSTYSPAQSRGQTARHVHDWWTRSSRVNRSSLDSFPTLQTGDVDAEVRLVERGVLDEADRFFTIVEHLDRKPQRLELLNEHLEGLRHARWLDVLPLDDGLVRLDTAHDVVGLDREELLKDVGGAVRLERPYLHLAEPLTTELRLAPQWLLGDKGVRARRASVDLVLDEVVQLHQVKEADRDRLLERLPISAVAEIDLPVLGEPREPELLLDRIFLRAVEHRRGDVDAERLRGPPEVRLEDLADVHPARHPERVEDDVDRRAVRKERHVLDRKDLGDDDLVAVPARHLVADADLALLRDRDADHLVDAPEELVVVLAAEDRDVDDLPVLARRQAERGVLHLTRLLTEDRPEQSLLGGELGLALRRDLADEDVLGPDLGADVDDAVLVEVREGLLTDVRDVARDLLGPELGVACLALVLLDMDRGELVVLDDPVGEDDRVLVVPALPGHERDKDVLPEGELAFVGRVAIGQDLVRLDAVAHRDQRPLVEARALVRADELLKAVPERVAGVLFDPDLRRGDRTHHTGCACHHHLSGVARRAVLDAGADDRRLRAHDRNGLPLHVRTHEGAVGVVVLEERYEGGRHRDDLLRRDVHEIGGRRRGLVVLGAAVDLDALVEEASLLVEPRVRLHDRGELLLVGRQIDDLVGHVRSILVVAGDAAGGRLHESVRGPPAPGRERPDASDVRALRRLDRADAAVVTEVHVADVEPGALTRASARPEGREAVLVGQLVEPVSLLDELTELRSAEELLDRGHNRPDVDELLGRRLLGLDDGHALADHPFHAEQADAELALDEFANGADAAVAEVVDVVRRALSVVELDNPRDDLHKILVGERPRGHRLLEAELAVQLVAADLREVITPEIEEKRLHQAPRVVDRGRVARTKTLVDLDEAFVRVRGGVTVERRGDVGMLGIGVDGRKERGDLLVRGVPDRAQQRRHCELALAVDLHRDDVLVRRLELEPRAAVRDQLGVEESAAGSGIIDGREVHARRADELRHDDALGAVDHERALVGHPWAIAEEDILLGDLSRFLVYQLDSRPERLRVGEVLRAALLFGVLRLPELT